MGLDAQLKKALANFKKSDFQCFSGTVTQVDEDQHTVNITDLDGFEFYDVRLKAAQGSGDRYSILYPRIGSTVLVSMIGNDQNTLFVSMVNEVDKIAGAIGTINFKADANGYEIKAQGESLKDVLNDYIDEVNKIIVINGTTINVTNTTAIKTRLNKILK